MCLFCTEKKCMPAWKHYLRDLQRQNAVYVNWIFTATGSVPCKKIPWDNNAQVLSQGGKGAKKQITILLIPGRDYQNYTCAGPICSLLLYNPIYLWCFWCPLPGRQKTCLWKAAKHAKKRGTVRVQPAGFLCRWRAFLLGYSAHPRRPEKWREMASFTQVIKCEQPV